MENATPGVTYPPDADKTPEQIEREMHRTRDALTEKVAALESQVLGTIQNATDTVSETVQSVKSVVESVIAAPSAVGDTVKQTMSSVGDSLMHTVRDTIGSFSVSGCVRGNPLASLGASTAAGFLAGYFLLGGRSSRPLMARGAAAPAPGGRAGPAVAAAYTAPPAAENAGWFGGVGEAIGKELRELAGHAISTAVASLKQGIGTQVPGMVDAALHTVTDRVGGANGPGAGGTTRVGGPEYAAKAPAAGS